MTVRADPASSVLDRIRRTLVDLRMPRALEAIETLLAEKLSLRESRRIKTALGDARLSTIKTFAGFDFTFQPGARPQPRPGARPVPQP